MLAKAQAVFARPWVPNSLMRAIAIDCNTGGGVTVNFAKGHVRFARPCADYAVIASTVAAAKAAHTGLSRHDRIAKAHAVLDRLCGSKCLIFCWTCTTIFRSKMR